MLNGDTSAERLYSFDVMVADGFAVIEKPMQAVERRFAIHFFKHIKKSRDALVIGGMEAEWPAMLREQ